ncbi:hypothetical protein MKX47_10010 [Solibacillus sp. FSL R7-0668]|uniref:hypothetical protein n=1 Tax=Solibacillus sp. FSL R7-0668 TaxID=2921688 RepID=UPI0030F63DF5
MKKIIISFVAFLMVITSFFLFFSEASDESRNEAIESALVKSMDETKKEKEKIIRLLSKIPQEINKNRYGLTSLSYSPDGRIFTVQAIDSNSIKNQKNIEKIIKHNAGEMAFENFEMKFIALDSDRVTKQEDNKLIELNTVLKIATEYLKEKGYDHFSSGITESTLEVSIEVSNGNLVNKDELEKQLAHVIFSNTNLNFEVSLREKDKSEMEDQLWQPIFEVIREETEKEFDEYRGFAYSFHPEPLQIIIKTNIESPKLFGKSKKQVKRIVNYVDKIIELKFNELAIEKIPYTVIVRDKNNKTLR